MKKTEKSRLKTFFLLVEFIGIARNYMTLEFARHHSNPMRLLTMNALYMNGGSMSPTELSKRLYRSKHSVTSMIDTLEKQGLVCREPNPGDRRSITVSLTPQGKQFFEKMIPIGREMSQRALSCLDDEQVETLDSIMRQVKNHLLTQIARSGDDNGEF